MMASGFNGWAGVFHDGALWHALGQPKGRAIRPLAIGTRVQSLAAADDFLRATETGTASIKSRRWLNDPATMKQMDLLQRAGEDAGLMPLDDEAFDDLVPQAVVRELLHALCRSLLTFLAAICPTPRE